MIAVVVIISTSITLHNYPFILLKGLLKKIPFKNLSKECVRVCVRVCVCTCK